MKRLAWVYVVGIVASMILLGCKGGDGPQGPAGDAITGSFHGRVYAYDSFGNYLGYISGVTVSFEGTSLSGVSDSLGNYVITNVPTRMYTLVFAKVGYGTMKEEQVQYIGGSDYYYGTTGMGGIPNFEASTATAVIATGTMTVAGTVTGGTPPYSRRVNIYVGKTAAINPSNPSTFVEDYSTGIASSSAAYTTGINVASLMSNYGFTTGSTIYVAVYSTGYYGWSYYDYASDRSIETCFGATVKTASVVIP